MHYSDKKVGNDRHGKELSKAIVGNHQLHPLLNIYVSQTESFLKNYPVSVQGKFEFSYWSYDQKETI